MVCSTAGAMIVWRFILSCFTSFNTVCDAMFFFFFFQAEDGIRDLTVTGVQTCALPISAARFRSYPRAAVPQEPGRPARLQPLAPRDGRALRAAIVYTRRGNAARSGQIGRASCRERV